MSNAPELVRLASRLTKSDIDAVILILEVSHPGLTRGQARNTIEALASAGRKLNAGERTDYDPMACPITPGDRVNGGAQ